MTHSICDDVIGTYRRTPTIREGRHNSKTNHFRRKWIAITFPLKVVSLILKTDNSWSTIPICNIFRWHESRILFLRLIDQIKCVWHVANVLQSCSKYFGANILKQYPRGQPGITYKDFQHQLQLHQHYACFVFLELLLLWHYSNNAWYAIRFSLRSFLMSIWRMQISNMKQHQQSHQ